MWLKKTRPHRQLCEEVEKDGINISNVNSERSDIRFSFCLSSRKKKKRILSNKTPKWLLLSLLGIPGRTPEGRGCSVLSTPCPRPVSKAALLKGPRCHPSLQTASFMTSPEFWASGLRPFGFYYHLEIILFFICLFVCCLRCWVLNTGPLHWAISPALFLFFILRESP